MSLTKLVFKPGINRDQTNYSNEGGWYDCDKIRFRSGFPEKIGGWVAKSFNPYEGACRSLYSYGTFLSTGVALSGTPLLGIGTSKKVYIGAGTAIYDITPLRAVFYGTTATPPPSPPTPTVAASLDNGITTGAAGSKIVTVTCNAHGADAGDYVELSGVVGPIDGIPAADFNKSHEILTVTTNNFTIEVATACTSGGIVGGGTAIIAYFDIVAGTDIGEEGFGWGTGTWSRGTWGSSSTNAIYEPPRLIHQDNFNSDLIFNIRDAVGAIADNIYIWQFNSNFDTRAINLSDVPGADSVPQQVGQILFASSGHLLALSCTTFDPAEPGNLGYYDPLMIRWANVDADIGPEPENWNPTPVESTAGDLRVKSGSKIVRGLRTRQEVLVWTDSSLSALRFTGTEEVFNLEEVGSNISIIGPNAVANANNTTYWMGVDKFYFYNGTVNTLPCSVRQYVFKDINLNNSLLFFAGSNAQFNEVIWFYCSASANEIDRYVIYNYVENIWYYGNLSRTAWFEEGLLPNPVAASSGWIFEHEVGNDDGQPLGVQPLPITSYIQSSDVDIEEGENFMLIRRVIPDVNFTGSETVIPGTSTPTTPQVIMTVGVRNFPGAANVTTNEENQSTARNITTATATINQYTNQVFVRARGRQMNFKIESNNIGTQWQLGMPRVDARPDGRRG